MLVMETKTSSYRLPWIDAARIFAMLAVVLGHSIGESHLPGQKWFAWWIVSWDMPLFLVLSGFTSYKSLCKSDSISDLGSYIIKLGKRMMIPAAFIGISISVANCAEDGEFIKCIILSGCLLIMGMLYLVDGKQESKWPMVVMSLFAIVIELFQTHFWFITMLFCINAIWIICNIVSKKMGGKVNMTHILYSMTIILFGIFSGYSMIGDMGIYLMAGMLLGGVYEKGCQLLNSKVLLVILPIIAGSLYLYMGRYVYFYDYPERMLYNNGIFHLYITRQICGILWSIWFLILFKRLFAKYNTFCYWGTLTLGIYTVHGYFLRYISYIYSYVEYSEYNWIVGIVIGVLPAIILSALSICIVYIFKRYKFTRVMCLGERE